MNWCRRLILPLLLLVPLVAGPAQAQGARPVGGPRVVLQSRPMGIDVAVFTPDGKYIIAASAIDREVLLIDVAKLLVIDRKFIPTTIHKDGLFYLRFDGMTVSLDGRSVVIHGICARGAFDLAGQVRDIGFDIQSRKLTLLQSGDAVGETSILTAFQQRLKDIQSIFEPEDPLTVDATAVTRLPKLPASPDGRYQLERVRDGLLLRAAKDSGLSNRELALSSVSSFNDASLAADGRRLMMLDYHTGNRASENTLIRRMDVTTGRFEPPITVPSDYGFVRWIDNDNVLIVSNADESDRAPDADEEPTPPLAMVMAWNTGEVVRRLDGYCYVKPLGNGDFIAAGPGNCSPDAKAARGVFRFDHVSARWSRLPVPFLAGRLIDKIAVSDDGRLVALVTEDAKGDTFVHVNDAVTGKEVDQLSYQNGAGAMTGEPRFDPEDKHLYVPTNTVIAEWTFGTATEIRQIDTRTSLPQFVLVGRGQVFASGALDSSIARGSVRDGKALPDLDLDRAVAGGFIEGRDLFWAVSQSQGFRLWETQGWKLVLSTFVFPSWKGDNSFLSVTPNGRYDTNLGPDEAPFRWIVDDAPLQSLAPQTFMRDYFTPRLGQKLVDCLSGNDCPRVLPPLPPVASLNRLLPKVKIVGYAPGDKPGEAKVTVEVSEAVDPSARGRATHSGAYDVRLFIGGRMVAHAPNPLVRASEIGMQVGLGEITERMNSSIEDWRKLSKVETDEDGSPAQFEFNVAVPTQPTNPGSWALGLSAYAFNSDRVKGETTWLQVPRPAQAPRPRRAFVVAIGISAYDASQLQLQFAAKDAHLLTSRLSALPGYDVRLLPITAEQLDGGKVRKVGLADIAAVVSMLAAGKSPDDDATLKRLGIDPRLIDQATPDDAVILSFSGHGWADPSGKFYLLASDAQWPDGAPSPVPDSILSTTTLVPLIDLIDAGEMAIIIDACHSAASVATSDFKPGPMGDASLGQLAYDKKIRVLAATQGDDVAREASRYGQGLLTWALAGEGLKPGAPAADSDGNGVVTLDEWLRYASRRLPHLSEEALASSTGGAGSDDDGLVFVNRVRAKPKVQEPALFDFNRVPSDLILTGAAR